MEEKIPEIPDRSDDDAEKSDEKIKAAATSSAGVAADHSAGVADSTNQVATAGNSASAAATGADDITTTIRVLGQRVILSRQSIPHLALTLMLVGILVPAAYNSFRLAQSNPTPSQLLIAICISLFSAVVFLWILDATSILRFRAEWISKSVYGAAIASVLGTSVGVYRDAFNEQKYPYEGRWEVMVRTTDQQTFLADHDVVMVYSRSVKAYWGYGETKLDTDNKDLAASLEVIRFSPGEKTLVVRLIMQDGSETVLDQKVTMSQDDTSIASDDEAAVRIRLSRAR